jgi:hypothetical protein
LVFGKKRRLQGESLAYLILTREKTRNESRLNEYRQLVPAACKNIPANFAPSMVATKSRKVPQSKKSSSSNSPCFEDARAW